MNLKFKNYWVIFGLIQVILAFCLCLCPIANTPVRIPHLDKLFHFFAYLLLTFYQIQIHGVRKSKLIFMFFCIQGILIEILQLFTGYRSFEWWDMAANASGSLYAIYFCYGL